MAFFDPNELVGGVPLRDIRKVIVRADGPSGASVPGTVAALKVSAAKAKSLLTAMEQVGFLERTKDGLGLTEKGISLGNARFLKRISRPKADLLVRGLLRRAQEVNDSPAFLYRVAYIGVFGSYTTTASTLGDIDLIIRLKAKEPNRKRHNQLCQEQIQERLQEGRPFRDLFEELWWPEMKVKTYLKARSGYLAFMTDSLLKNGTRPRLRKLFPVRRSKTDKPLSPRRVPRRSHARSQ